MPPDELDPGEADTTGGPAAGVTDAEEAAARATSDPNGGNGPAGTPLAPTAGPALIAGAGATAGPAAGPPAAAATGGGADDKPPAGPALAAAVDGGGDTGGANGAAGPPRPALKPREKSDDDATGPWLPPVESPLPPSPAGELKPCDGRPPAPSPAGELAAGVDGMLRPPPPKPDDPAAGIDGAPPLPDPRLGMLIGGDNADGVPASVPLCSLWLAVVSPGSRLPVPALSLWLESSEPVPVFDPELFSSPPSCSRRQGPPLVLSLSRGASFGAGPRRQPADIPLAESGAHFSGGALGFPPPSMGPEGLSPRLIEAP